MDLLWMAPPMRALDEICLAWYSDCSVEWSAAAAVVGALSALAATWAAYQAKNAARTALLVDQNVERRTKDREERDAAPLAMAFDTEIGTAVTYAIIATSGSYTRKTNTERVRSVRELAGPFHLKTLERFVVNLGCFDKQTGLALAEALAAANFVQWAMNPDPGGPHPSPANSGKVGHLIDERFAADDLDRIMKACSSFIDTATTARRLLRPYIGRAVTG